MPDEGFLRRWSRRKTESRLGQALPAEPLQPVPEEAAPQVPGAALPADAGARVAGAVAPAAEPPLPTMADVAGLTPDSDYSAFVARGVDLVVRRSALKKLFADPHFNTMDGLDIYIDDYTRASPLSETMLASLRHAARLFERAADEDDAAPVQDEVAVVAPAAAVAEQAADPAPGDDPRHQQHPQHPPETETR